MHAAAEALQLCGYRNCWPNAAPVGETGRPEEGKRVLRYAHGCFGEAQIAGIS
ncbi:hypothetical protein [Paenibacillus sp. YSY-4.3]